MDAIRYRPRSASQNYVDATVAGATSLEVPLVTVNKTTGVAVQAGDPVPWDPANATQNITVLAAFSADGKTVTLPYKGVYDVDYLSFPGNAFMKFFVAVNGAQTLPLTGAASAGTILTGRFRTLAANATVRVHNANLAPETLAGDAQLSISFRSI